ncbi:Alpha/Beta hydrolase protein [Aspergillus ambiguus]|uniref:alpha/beta hydrolase n=1 Tax=Aspergillus ambiguus TaxID=176160 RepID=UPI003CCD5C02
MRDEWTRTQSTNCSIPNIASYEVSNKKDHTYLVQISWPLGWDSEKISTLANILYLVDGNAVFLSATDIVRRRQARNLPEPGTIVVGIGYPLRDFVFSPRRAFDLTPPSDHYTPPAGPDGQPRPQPHGGADQLIDLITEVIRPLLHSVVFPNVRVSRTALFGHSYGGLFVLHTLFTQPALFDTYLAASPSIWWNDRFILSEEEEFYQKPSTSHNLALWLSYGSLEQFPVRQRDETPEQFEQRKRGAALRRMAYNCCEVYTRLAESSRLCSVEKRAYADEDHGSVIAAALSGGISYFLNLEN